MEKGIQYSLHTDPKCNTESILTKMGYQDPVVQLPTMQGSGEVKCARVNKDAFISFKAEGWGQHNISVPMNHGNNSSHHDMNNSSGNSSAMSGQKYGISGDGYDVTIIDDKKYGG